MTETKDLAVLDHARFEMLATAIGPALDPIIAKYVTDCSLTLEALPPLLDACDHEQVRSIAHRMKGASSSLGLLRLEHAFRDLEALAVLKLGPRADAVSNLRKDLADAEVELELRAPAARDPR